MKNGKFYTSAMYWVPLIAIYTGARMSEILQLEKHDIFLDKDTNIWAINISDIDPKSSDPDKHVKIDGSYRQTPVHKALIELGFIDYVQTRNSRLFPDEDRNNIGKFDKFQKRFTTYRKQVGVEPQHALELRDFHSIRHTVRTKLTELRTTKP